MSYENPNKIMTTEHPNWEDFHFIVGFGSCNHSLDWTKAILYHCFPDVNIDLSIAYFQRNGGFCDCEVWLNVDRRPFEEAAKLLKERELTLKFYGTPAHGYLEVPIKILEKLEITELISKDSFMRNTIAYLEEDGDTCTFLAAAKEANIPIKINEISIEEINFEKFLDKIEKEKKK